jgi:gluconolactonase
MGLAAIVAAACTHADDDGGDTDTDVEALCPEPGGVTTVAAGVGNTEGVTIAPDGTAYVVVREAGHSPGLHRLEHDGTTTPLASFTSGIGAVWWKGAVWVGRPGDAGGELLEITPDGDVTTHAVDAPPAPNFLTPTPWGTLLVADDGVDVIEEVDPSTGDVATWAEVPSPNGMAFSPDGATLWVASTFRQPALWSIPVAGGAAGEPARVVDLAGAPPPDGVAVGVDGAVYVALNAALGGRILRWKDGVADDVPLASDVASPASLAFGRGSWDACAVLVTELFGQDVVQVDLGVTGFFPSWEEGPVDDATAR